MQLEERRNQPILLWVEHLVLSHVCGVAAIVLHTQLCVYLFGKYGKTRDSCLLSVEKMEWESPPSIMVTRNPNWSQRSGTETGCVKGRY
jgi:hypothetical protein